MDWGHFWTIVAQVLIGSAIIIAVLFVGSAALIGAVQGYKERHK